MQTKNLYAKWCREARHEPKEHYAFKCMGGVNHGADMIEPMRGSNERASVACTVAGLAKTEFPLARLHR